MPVDTVTLLVSLTAVFVVLAFAANLLVKLAKAAVVLMAALFLASQAPVKERIAKLTHELGGQVEIVRDSFCHRKDLNIDLPFCR